MGEYWAEESRQFMLERLQFLLDCNGAQHGIGPGGVPVTVPLVLCGMRKNMVTLGHQLDRLRDPDPAHWVMPSVPLYAFAVTPGRYVGDLGAMRLIDGDSDAKPP